MYSPNHSVCAWEAIELSATDQCYSLPRKSFALRPLGRGNDRFALRGVCRPNHFILSALHLGDEHGMLVLAVSIELHWTEWRVRQIYFFDGIANRLRLVGLGI